jgi:hypothetical protein
VYNGDVLFREIKDIDKSEVLPREEEPNKKEFELKENESNSIEEHESEVEEPHTPVLSRSVWKRRKSERYTPLDFH